MHHERWSLASSTESCHTTLLPDIAEPRVCRAGGGGTSAVRQETNTPLHARYALDRQNQYSSGPPHTHARRAEYSPYGAFHKPFVPVVMLRKLGCRLLLRCCSETARCTSCHHPQVSLVIYALMIDRPPQLTAAPHRMLQITRRRKTTRFVLRELMMKEGRGFRYMNGSPCAR